MYWREKLRRIPVDIIVLFVVLGAVLGVAGRAYYQREERQFTQAAKEQLSTIAETKATQIARWRQERVLDVGILHFAPYISDTVGPVLLGRAGARVPPRAIEVIALYRKLHGFDQLVGVDRKGAVRLTLPGGAGKLSAQCAAAAAEALRSGTAVFSDLHLAEEDSGARACVANTLPPPGGRGPATGTIVFRLDPRLFLDPLMQTWPTASPTAETLLVRREGDDVVYLSELRHRKGTALKLRLPLGTEGLIEAMAVKGRTGLMEGRDYRGVAVLGAAMPVAGTPWYLVAKVDLEELRAALREQAWWLYLVMGLLLTVAGASTAFLWRNRRASFYRRLYEAEQQHRIILSTAIDGIAVIALDGRFLEVNDAYCQMVGYSREELLTMRVPDVEAQETAGETRRHISRIRETGLDRFETRQRRKDGRIIALEAGATYSPHEGGRLVVFVREITERKRAEERIRILAALVDSSPASILVHDWDGNMLFANQRTLDYHGYSMDEFMRLNLRDLDVPESAAQIASRMQLLAERGEISFEVAHHRKDRSIIPLITNVRVARWGDREVILSVATDLTERRRAEEVARAERDLGLALSETSSLQQAVKHCLASAMAVSGMDSGGVYLVNEDGSLDLLVHQGLSETLIQAASHYEAQTSNARLVHAGRPVYVPPMSAELRGAALLLADGVTAVAILPIRDRGKTVACLNLASHARQDIPQSVRTALERIASRIGPAIIRARAEEALRDSQDALARSREELRALAASLLNAQEEERRRVSRELHDDLNQRLAVLAMQADSLAARLPLPVGELRRELKSLEKQVAGLSDDVRRMASQLHPSVLEHLGLAAALRSHCTQFSAREGIPIEFEQRGLPAKVSPEAALCLYRIAQEALHNLARHARATRGSVTLAGSEAGIELSIADDGEGFDPQAGRSGGGLGLLSMEERARLAGGTLVIRSSPGQGTRIEARVPVV